VLKLAAECHPVGGSMEVRHQIVAVSKHAVEGTRDIDKLGPRAALQGARNQRIDS
jgi:hypothetical protein